MNDFFYGGVFSEDFVFAFRFTQGHKEDFHTLEYFVQKSRERYDWWKSFLSGEMIDLKTWPFELEIDEHEYSHLNKLLENKDEVFYRTKEERGIRLEFPKEYKLFEEIEKRMQKWVGRRSY